MRRPRRPVSVEAARSPLWLWPTAAAGAALVAGLLLTRVRPERGSALALLWGGDVDSASTVLQVVATSVMTATALTFSLTLVALQLAAQQYSPRLLRTFSRDPVTKRVLSVLSATFVFATATLTGIRGDERVPAVGVFLAFLLGIASLGALLGFIAHIVKLIRVDTMMLVVQDETQRAIATFYPPFEDDGAPPDDLTLDPSVGSLITAVKSGFVQRTSVAVLVEGARAHDALVRVEVRAGDHVVKGAPLAVAWRRSGAAYPAAPDGLVQAVREAVAVGYERTIDQDTAFGFRELEDIAVKAMSPAINDPVTAAHAVGHMADLLVRLSDCRLGPTLHRDDDGVGRAIVPDRDFRYYLDLASGQLRRFAANEPSVLLALLRMLRSVAVACRDEDQRREVRRAAALVSGQMASTTAEADASLVHDMVARIELALSGDTIGAFDDRAGETKSI